MHGEIAGGRSQVPIVHLAALDPTLHGPKGVEDDPYPWLLLQFFDKCSTLRGHFRPFVEIVFGRPGRAREFQRRPVSFPAQEETGPNLYTLPGGGCGRARASFLDIPV